MSNRAIRSPSADDAAEPLLGTPSTIRHDTNRYSTFQPTPVRTKTKQPNRTTKTSQKLKLFPDNGSQAMLMPEEFDADVYSQLAQIPHGTAKVEAEKLSKMNKEELSRVTAYCTSS